MCVDLDQLEDDFDRDNLICELVQSARKVPRARLEMLVDAAGVWADGATVTFHLLPPAPGRGAF